MQSNTLLTLIMCLHRYKQLGIHVWVIDNANINFLSIDSPNNQSVDNRSTSNQRFAVIRNMQRQAIPPLFNFFFDNYCYYTVITPINLQKRSKRSIKSTLYKKISTRIIRINWILRKNRSCTIHSTWDIKLSEKIPSKWTLTYQKLNKEIRLQ